MLVSNPIKQIGGVSISISVSEYGYTINNDTLSLDDIMTLYFINQNMLDPINSKYTEHINKFFNNQDFIFINNLVGNQMENITNQIKLLNNINELTIKNYISKYPNITSISIIDFYIKFITEITKLLRTLDKNVVIFQLYTLSLKDNELLNILNKENNIIIKNTQSCLSQILKTLHKEDLDNEINNNLNNNIQLNQNIINNNNIINDNNNIINDNNNIINDNNENKLNQ